MRLVRALYFLAGFAIAVFAQTDWLAYGHDPGGMHFPPLKQIDTGNVNHLVRTRTYHTGEMPVVSGRRGQRQTAFETTPLIAGGVFVAAANDNRFRAFDARTSSELWPVVIDASGHATPATYLGKGGKQYVAIAAGGGGFFGSPPSGALIAFKLPDWILC